MVDTLVGRLRIDNTDRTDCIFVEMLTSEYQLRTLMTNETAFDRADLEAHVNTVVAQFLNGTRPH